MTLPSERKRARSGMTPEPEGVVQEALKHSAAVPLLGEWLAISP
jgi:hypothetical protein